MVEIAAQIQPVRTVQHERQHLALRRADHAGGKEHLAQLANGFPFELVRDCRERDADVAFRSGLAHALGGDPQDGEPLGRRAAVARPRERVFREADGEIVGRVHAAIAFGCPPSNASSVARVAAGGRWNQVPSGAPFASRQPGRTPRTKRYSAPPKCFP